MEANVIHHLKKLHTAAVDARNGYREGLKDAEGKGLSGLFAQMGTLHNQHAEALEQALVAAGETPDEKGSFMTVVHEAIMNIRALFGGLGESVLPGLIDGEKRNLAKYDDALEELSQTPSPERTLLTLQRERLAATIAAMKSERDEVRASAQ